MGDLWFLRGAVALKSFVVGRKSDAPPDADVEPDPETALLRLQRFFVRIDWSDLLQRRVHLRELELDAPAVRLERTPDGRIDPLGTAGAPPSRRRKPARKSRPSPGASPSTASHCARRT